jgi:hypothetical protein
MGTDDSSPVLNTYVTDDNDNMMERLVLGTDYSLALIVTYAYVTKVTD